MTAYWPSEPRIASTIDLAHPADPDQCLYLKGAEAPPYQ
jgi:hypothetical protein